jgi:hypothetical protein
MSKIVAIELYSKDGSHFVENFEDSTATVEIFCLEDGVWIQDCMPPLVDNDYTGNYDHNQQMEMIAIMYMDNENRNALLTRLNEISRLQQLHDKAIDIEQGDVIINTLGEIIGCFP